MNILPAVMAAAKDPPSLHDVSEAVPAVVFFWGIIVGLTALVIWFVVRDRNSIAASIKQLAMSIDKLAEDLPKNYTTTREFNELRKRVDRHLEHSTQRIVEVERRAVLDAEGPEFSGP